MTYQDLLVSFINFEEDNHLFDLKYFNINFWQFVRHNVFSSIRITYFNAKSIEPGFNEQADLKQSKREFKELLKNVKNTEVLVFNHPRRSLKDGIYVNVHTDYIASELSKTFNIKIVEEPFLVENRIATEMHLKPCYFEKTFYTDSIENICGAKIKKFKQTKKYFKLEKFVDDIIILLCNKFGNLNTSFLKYILTNQILYLKYSQSLFKKLLKTSKAKAVLMFYSPSHTKSVLCAVSKKLNLTTIDLQHGMQTTYEPFFYVVKNKKRSLDIYPDKIFAFGNNTVNTTNYCENISKNIYPVGNYNLEIRYNQLKDVKKPENIKNILFISQTVLGQDLKLIAKELATMLENNSEYHIIYKLHPYEFESDFEDLTHFKNISVISNLQQDINYLQKTSYCQIGVFSTALYEGVKFNLPTFVIDNLYGVQFTYELLKNVKSAKYVTSAKEIFNDITKGALQKPTEEDVQSLWANNALENITKLLMEITNGK